MFTVEILTTGIEGMILSRKSNAESVAEDRSSRLACSSVTALPAVLYISRTWFKIKMIELSE
jgi:hypothetical protein